MIWLLFTMVVASLVAWVVGAAARSERRRVEDETKKKHAAEAEA
jgi:hypothetical protein